jgi:hypothetical protein
MKRLLPKPTFFTVVFLFLSLFFVCGVSAQTNTFTGSINNDWYTAGNWSTGTVPSTSISGTVTINANVVVSSITVNGPSGVLIVNSPYTLTVGVVGNAATLEVVDFQNNSTVNINSGASLVVYGALNNSNNSTGITFDGSVSVVGNVTVGNNSTVVGSGSLTTTGSITGAGTVFGSGNDCSPGPCNGGNLCTFTNVISSNQNVCSNAIPTNLTSSTTASSPSYQWQSSTTSGGGFVNISGATNSTYVFPFSLSQTTYYRLKITSSSCTSNSSQVKITVTPTVGTPVFTLGGSSTRCQGAGSVTYTASATNNTGLTYGLDATTLAFAGNSIVAGTGVVTYAAGWSGTSTITVSAAGCNGPKIATHTVTVNPLPTAPTFAEVDITQPDCKIPTGSVILRGLPPSGTINQTGTVINTYPITGSTLTISGLTSGTYNFSVFVGGCSSSPSGNVVIDPVTTATWNVVSGVGSWTDGPPTLSKALVFDGNYSENTDVVGCSCEVKSGTIKILDGKTMTITNGVSVSGGASLIFENNASLVQDNDAAVNVGNITYKRLTNTVVRNTDYTYWSTPVSPLNLGGTGGISYNPSSLVGSIFYSYEVTAGSENWKGESATSPMIVGKGYSIRGPGPISYSPLSLLEATFTGRPNNGRYPITGINPFKSYLLGNPYPSALDADKFLRDNADVIDGTLYFWTHSTKIGIGVVNPGTGVYAYSGDDYASYNLTGGVGTDGVAYPQGGVQAPSSPGFKPTGKIGAGQGFFATSNTTIKGANEIVFNNSMRVGVGGITGDNSQFFKTNSTKSKTTSAIEKNRVWLNLTNTQGAFKQLLVGYITGATNDYDNGYDGETFDGNEFLDFYSVNQEKNFVIQGRALPFDVNDEVSLGYRSVAAGDFSIGIDEVDGVILSQKVFIEDKLLNVAHDLKASPYDFTTQAGTFNDRFVLHYKDKTLGADDFDKTENQVLISKDKNELKIKSELESIKRITVFDLLGRKIFDKEAVDSNEFRTSNITLNKQLVVVKVILANGKEISKKVIY